MPNNAIQCNNAMMGRFLGSAGFDLTWLGLACFLIYNDLHLQCEIVTAEEWEGLTGWRGAPSGEAGFAVRFSVSDGDTGSEMHMAMDLNVNLDPDPDVDVGMDMCVQGESWAANSAAAAISAGAEAGAGSPGVGPDPESQISWSVGVCHECSPFPSDSLSPGGSVSRSLFRH